MNKEQQKEPGSDAGLSPKTNIKIRMDLLIMFVTTIFSCAFGTAMVYHKLEVMDACMKQAWTVQEQILWVSQFKVQNPGINVPAPADIVTLMNQKGIP